MKAPSTIITPDLIGKKIRCKIHDSYVVEGLIVADEKNYYILQNVRFGASPPDRKLQQGRGYQGSWGINISDSLDPSRVETIYGIRDLYLLNSEPEIINNYQLF